MMKLNLATKITLIRIALIPFIALFYILAVMAVGAMAEWGRLIALILFILAVITDHFDGKIARKRNEVTKLGNLLDTVADKLLMMLGFILIISDYVFMHEAALPYWFAVIVAFVSIGRDFIITMLKSLAQEQGITIMADKLGKIKFTLQFVAISLYMLVAFMIVADYAAIWITMDTIWFDILTYACIFLMSAATILSVYSCFNYIRNFLITLKEKNAPVEAGADFGEEIKKEENTKENDNNRTQNKRTK